MDTKRIRLVLPIILSFMGLGMLMSYPVCLAQNQMDNLPPYQNDGDYWDYYDVKVPLLKTNGQHREVVDFSLDVLSEAEHFIQLDPKIISRAYVDVARSYASLGIADSTLHMAVELNLFLDKMEDSGAMTDFILANERIWAYRIMAIGYGNTGSLDEGLSWLEKGVDLVESLDVVKAVEEYPEFRYGHLYAVLGSFMRVSRRFDEEKVAYNEFMKEAERLNDPRLKAEAQFLLARQIAGTRNYQNIQLAIDAYKEIDMSALSNYGLIRPWVPYIELAKLFGSEGGGKGQIDSVKYYTDKALVAVLQTDDYQAISDIYWLAVTHARAEGDWEWAYHSHVWSTAYDKQILRSQSERNIGRLENQYENQKAQNELNLELAGQKNRNTLIVLGAIALLLINVFVIRSLRLSRKARRLENIAREKLESDRELEELKKEKLSNILEFKNRQLATTTLSTERLNSQMTLMIEKLSSIDLESNPGASKEIDSLIRELNSINNLQDNWALFYKHFESVHPNFFNKLIEVNQDLTQNELRHCAYVLMNLSNKEVAHMYNISPNSVKTAKNRLKKKLNLSPSDSLSEYIYKLSDLPAGQYLKQA